MRGQTKLWTLITLVLIVSLVLTACGGDQYVGITSDEADATKTAEATTEAANAVATEQAHLQETATVQQLEDAEVAAVKARIDAWEKRMQEDPEGAIAGLEQAYWENYAWQLQIQPLTDSDRENIARFLNGGENFGYATTGIDDAGQMSVLSAPDVASIAIPVAQIAAGDLDGLINIIKSMEAYVAQMWYPVAHWTSHLLNPYDLWSNLLWVSQIVKGGLSGFGVVLYFPGNETYQEQYVFITRLAELSGQGRLWMANISPKNGAIITTFNIGLRNGVYTEKEAARYFAKLLQRGYSIVEPGNIPESITRVWGKDVPSAIKALYWGAEHQLRTAVERAGQSWDVAKYTLPSVLQMVQTSLPAIAVTDPLPLFFLAPADPCQFINQTCGGGLD